MMRMRMGQLNSSTDLHTFIRYVRDDSGFFSNNLMTPYQSTRPYIDQYVRAPNRLAFGERTVIVMSSKVAQKSYGTEKRCVFTL